MKIEKVRYIKGLIGVQKYTSAKTSVNTLTKVYTKMDFSRGDVILDYGGGKYDTNKDYMKTMGKVLYVYDPFNRPEAENKEVIHQIITRGGADYVVCANVLNVIAEDYVIQEILTNVWNFTKPGGIMYIQIYEGNKTGNMEPTTRGFQRNWKADNYVRFFNGQTYKKSGNIFTLEKPVV